MKKIEKLFKEVISWICIFGWIVIIWSPIHNWKFFFTWIGCWGLAVMYRQLDKEEEKKKKEKEVQDDKEENIPGDSKGDNYFS